MMTPKHLTGGDLLQDASGRYVTLVRNHDSGDLFAVSIEGLGEPGDVRIQNLSSMGDGFIISEYTPIVTAYQREETAAKEAEWQRSYTS